MANYCAPMNRLFYVPRKTTLDTICAAYPMETRKERKDREKRQRKELKEREKDAHLAPPPMPQQVSGIWEGTEVGHAVSFPAAS